MGEDITKLKKSIQNISKIIGKKAVEKIPESDKKETTEKARRGRQA